MTKTESKRKERLRRKKEGYERLEVWTLKKFREKIKRYVKSLHIKAFPGDE